MAGFASGQDEGNIVILIINPKKISLSCPVNNGWILASFDFAVLLT